MAHLLSKSKYIRGLQCIRALWLDVYSPQLARYSREQMRLFDRGRQFEYAFKATFPQGIDISNELRRNVDAYPARTAELLDQEGNIDLFEAGFLYDEVLVLADVVHKRADGSLDIYEIKSGSTLTDTYRHDAALQHYVISHCRSVHSFNLVHSGIDDFVVTDLTADLLSQHSDIAANIATMKQLLAATSEPDIPTGAHCLEPYACPYRQHCQSGIRQLSLF